MWVSRFLISVENKRAALLITFLQNRCIARMLSRLHSHSNCINILQFKSFFWKKANFYRCDNCMKSKQYDMVTIHSSEKTADPGKCSIFICVIYKIKK